ncbi:MAG: hypothetical protein M5U26_12030 [Planctomycetota bacterium]|nr:hypothetical protein [Planctomycetota bacterium]
MFRNDVLNKLMASLDELGFSKGPNRSMQFMVTNDVIGKLAFSVAHFQSAGFNILPTFTLNHLKVMDLAKDFSADGLAPHCVFFTIQMLSNGAFIRMEFEHLDKNVDQKISELVTVIKAYALPYMKSNCSLERIAELMDTESDEYKFSGKCNINVPVAYTLLGNRKRALGVIQRAIEGYSNPKWRDRELADSYFHFAERFIRHFYPEEKQLLRMCQK